MKTKGWNGKKCMLISGWRNLAKKGNWQSKLIKCEDISIYESKTANPFFQIDESSITK